jgi:hypothetical protein
MVWLAEQVRLGDHAAAELDDVLPRIWDELAAAAPPPLQL